MIIQSITPGSTTCNAQALIVAIRQRGSEHWLPIPLGAGGTWCITLGECEKLVGKSKADEMIEWFEALQRGEAFNDPAAAARFKREMQSRFRNLIEEEPVGAGG